MGPKLSLAIQYAPFNPDNSSALGIGCALGLSSYDRLNHLLTTSTGEQYKTIESGDGLSVSIKQKNAENFSFIKISNTEYHYIKKSGEVEILSSIGMSPDYFVPIQIITPVGYQLNLSWQTNAGQNQLVWVKDEKNLLCEFTYDPACSIRIYPDTSEEYQISIGTQNNYLTSYQISAGSDIYTWNLEYTTVGGEMLLTRITDPSGYVESASYKDAVMQFPPSANMPALPAVVQYIQSPGMSQPDTTTTYAYSSYNYLGFGIANSWDAEQDNCSTVLSDTVFYTSTETVSDGSENTKTTTRKFNNYHMLVTETIETGSSTRETNFLYYAQPGLEYEDQPPQFQQPTTRTMVWTEGGMSRTETVDTTYDEHGNRLTKHTTGKESIEWTYYPAAGEPDDEYTGCPPDPYGFVTNLKTRTVTPVASDLNDFSCKQAQFKYTSVDTRSGSPAATCALLCMTTGFRDDSKVQSNGITYETADADNYGRVASVTNTLIDDTPGYTLSLTYEIESDVLKQTATLTGYDKTMKTKSTSHSRLSNKLLSEQDNLGNDTEYTYDPLGRLVSRVLNPGTPYENQISVSYEIKRDDPGDESKVTDVITTYTDSSGNVQQIHYDGRHRPIRLCQNSIDSGQNSNFFDIAVINYNAFGHPANLTTTDYPDPLNTGTVYQKQMVFLYDDWGARKGIQYDSGQTKYEIYDPVALTQTEQITDNTGTPLVGSQITTFDVNRNPLKVERKDLDQGTVGTTTYVYDGAGRQRQMTDELGHSTGYDYDEFDRVSKQTAPDGTVIEKTYDTHSTESLIASIKVSQSANQVDLGTQTFDGLGRTTQTQTGGRTEIRSYSGGSDDPATVTDNAGITLSYSYVSQLQNAISHVGDGQSFAQDFTYEARTGRPIDANETGSLFRSSQWTPAGRLSAEQFTWKSDPPREANYGWTLQGKILSYTDVSGDVQQISYDAYGRLSKIADSAVSVAFAYDSAGRLYTQKATDSSSGASLTTQLTYDDLGREITRELAPSGGAPIVTITSTYYANDQLQSRKTVRGSEVLRDEQYEYDSRNRLVNYSCSTGSQPPVDGYGQAIASQSFTYDMLDNITQCVTAMAQNAGDQDTATFHYDNASDPTQLTSVTHAGNSAYPSSIALSYDANGRMSKDEKSRTLSYDKAGRLASVTSPDGSTAEYHYDANDMLAAQILNGSDLRQLYYRGQTLVDEVRAAQNQVSRFIRTANGCAAVSDGTMPSS
ncbi:YD repeat-containing protein [Paraburkholderia rhizosphaerae]|uniref:YD repeat-containing protein n=2 Tax=Paraburkholderia rhizosphaerae TaxID=480658 RepID=A0A4R8LLF3_9BURK|nr:YD repeat-containing protein [Paraburkholderia rhizosphaerae]